MSQKRKRGDEDVAQDAFDINDSPSARSVFRSVAIEDRSSTFVGLFSPAMKPKELQQFQDIASASHKIFAWRRESNQQAITGKVKFTTTFDDDGEKYAGKTVAKVLDNLQVPGVCVVARWYGGVMLGPVRFEHIEKCAVEAVKKWQASVAEEKSKKRKLEEDAAEKVKLITSLGERDQSISVLRALAAEKEEQARLTNIAMDEVNGIGMSPVRADKVSTASQGATAEPKVMMDYTKMPLDRLKAMEKARDATLAFLLKRIDRVEADLTSHADSG